MYIDYIIEIRQYDAMYIDYITTFKALCYYDFVTVIPVLT